MTRLLEIELAPEVIRRAQAGESAAQEQVYRSFAAAAYGVIWRLVPRRAVADDLLQDTFIEVLQSLRRFRGEAPLGVWIRRIAVSKCLMYLRSPWHRSLLWLDQQAGDSEENLLRAPSSRHGGVGQSEGASASQGAADADAQLDLEAALSCLSPSARAVVWLHDVEGYTHEEIAALYGKTVSFSKSQLMRAHGRLRRLLEEQSEESACTPLSTNS
jgi:RNA polymerase sigma-70 factor (ECF subfamily)